VVVEDGKAKKIRTDRRRNNDMVETMLKICFGFTVGSQWFSQAAFHKSFYVHPTYLPYPIINGYFATQIFSAWITYFLSFIFFCFHGLLPGSLSLRKPA
jgi:hypothetical protein